MWVKVLKFIGLGLLKVIKENPEVIAVIADKVAERKKEQ